MVLRIQLAAAKRSQCLTPHHVYMSASNQHDKLYRAETKSSFVRCAISAWLKQITWRVLQTQRTRQARPPRERHSQEARAQVRMRQTRQVLIHLLAKLPQHATCECRILQNSSLTSTYIVKGQGCRGYV